MNFSFFIFFIYSLGLGSTLAVELNSASLKEMVEQNNLDVLAKKSDLEAVVNRQGFLRRSFMPKLSLEGGFEKFSSGPYSGLSQPFGAAKAQVNIFNGQKDYFHGKLIDVQSSEKAFELEESKRQQLLDLRKLYWEYLYKRDLQKILNEGLALNVKNLASAKQRSTSGLSTNTDIIEFEQHQLSLSQNIEKIKLELEYLLNQIKNILMIEAGQIIVLNEVLKHHHNESEEPSAAPLDRVIAPQKLAIKIDQHQLEQKINQQWWMPSVDIYTAAEQFTQKDRDYLNQADRYDYSIGIKFNINLFDGGEAFNLSRSNKLAVKSIEYSQRNISRQIENYYQYSKNLIKLLDNQLHGAELAAKKAESYYQNTLKEYQRGIKNSPDVLGASQSFIQSKERVIELERDYQLALASLKSFIGE
jgi:outer membrane protein